MFQEFAKLRVLVSQLMQVCGYVLYFLHEVLIVLD